MLFEWLFGKKKSVFDLKQIPSGDNKYTLSDAKKHLKEHLISNRFGDTDEIRHELLMFSEYVGFFKEKLKDDLSVLREEITDEKNVLREVKADAAEFKKQKKEYVKANCLEDYNDDLVDYQDAVVEQNESVLESQKGYESQKLINERLAAATKQLLPRYIQALEAQVEPSYDHFYPAIRVWIRYESQKAKKSGETVTERDVEIQEIRPFGFSGFCHLRNSKRNFSFKGVLEYKASDVSDTRAGAPIFEYLLGRL